MGINKESLSFIINTINKHSLKINNCKMVELGNQELKGIGGMAKPYFQSLGINHVSIDINGKDGALKLDLQQEIKDIVLINKFDILTNFGTTEHVQRQYICWLNIHNLVKQNGLFIHFIPHIGYPKKHGYYKYSMEFFQKLSDSCGYEIIENFVRGHYIRCSMIKKKEIKFASNKIFNTFGISRG